MRGGSWPDRFLRGLAATDAAELGLRLANRMLGVAGAIGIGIEVFDLQSPGLVLVIPIVLIGFVWAFLSITLPGKRRGFRGKTAISITSGDVLDAVSAAHVAFTVNERFDCALGDRVDSDSIHGQVITRLFNSDQLRFARAVDASLSTQPHRPNAETPPGERPAYPIGTVATIDHGAFRLFAVALAHTDVDTHMASASLGDLLAAMSSLWAVVRERSNGKPVVVPLFGSGLSRVPVPSQTLLELILASIEAASTSSAISTAGIEIRIADRALGHINLRAVALTNSPR